jgi:hypothetical protein
MIIIWGSRLYGKVDDVPGMFHVATKFGHLWYIPLIPLGSHLVISKEGNGWTGAPVPISIKSILIAWLRAALIVATILSAIICIPGLPDPQLTTPGKVLLVAIPIVFTGLTIASFALKPLRRASYKRALQLAEHVGLSDEGKIMIELLYGRITKDDADKAFKQAAEDRAEIERLAQEQKDASAIPLS